MTRRPLWFVAWAVIAAAVCLIIGCSDDKSTTSTSALTVTLPAFEDLVTEFAPPVFDTYVGVPSGVALLPADTSLGFWTQGQGALLRHAFGADQSMALHRNMHQLGETVQWMNRVRKVGDTTFTDVPGDSGMLSGTMTVAQLRSTVGIPQACRNILGEEPLKLQYMVRVRINEQEQTRLQAGFRQDDTCDMMLAYHGSAAPDSSYPNAYEHCLTYAYRHRLRDSMAICAVHFKEYRNAANECAMWAYQITSRVQNQFEYRLTWFADDFVDSSGVGCLIGSGQSQTQFALRYQQMIPAERPEPDTADPHGHLYRLFGHNYADQGLTLSTAWNDATDPAKLYRYTHLPVALRYAPTDAGAALNPWSEE